MMKYIFGILICVFIVGCGNHVYEDHFKIKVGDKINFVVQNKPKDTKGGDNL